MDSVQTWQPCDPPTQSRGKALRDTENWSNKNVRKTQPIRINCNQILQICCHLHRKNWLMGKQSCSPQPENASSQLGIVMRKTDVKSSSKKVGWPLCKMLFSHSVSVFPVFYFTLRSCFLCLFFSYTGKFQVSSNSPGEGIMSHHR